MSDLTIHPLDWRSLKKGSSISQEQVIEFHKYHFPDYDLDDFAYMRVKDEIQIKEVI